MNLNRTAGASLIVLPVAFNVAFALLGQNFQYPDILRQPTAVVLGQFAAGGAPLVATWYAFMLSAVLFVPAAILLGRTLKATAPSLMSLAVPIGILAGSVQFIGLSRWPFVVPYLAGAYLAPGATLATREAIEIAFQVLNRYAGMAIGEHLGYLFTGAWTLLVSAALLSSQFQLKRGLAWIGVVSAIGILAGLLEGVGFGAAGAINAISYIVWSVWLIGLGAVLISKRQPST
ncbi:MAG: DUF4386 domain-containing protein [Thermoflexales bacterium]